VKFGIRLPQNGPFASKPNLLRTSELCESLGYHSLWVHDGSVVTLAEEKYKSALSTGSKETYDQSGLPPQQYEALSLLSFIGAKTKSIRLGTAATILPLWNPLTLARQCATIHELTDRRLILGVAIGAEKRVFEVYQIPFTERGRITEEYLTLLKQVLRPHPISSFEGRYVRFTDIEFHPAPTNLPLWYCGRAPPAIQRAAQHCEGWLPGSGYTPSRFKDGIKMLRGYAEESHRDLRGFTTGLETYLCLAESGAAARGIAGATLEAKRIRLDDRWIFVGSRSEVFKRLEAYQSVGVNFFEFKILASSFDQYLRTIGTFAKEIIPSFS